MAPKQSGVKKSAIMIWNAALGKYEAWDGVLNTGDIEIGAVEIKDATNSNRANVIATNGHYGLVAIAPGHVSTDNSTIATLGGGAVYTGTFEEVTNFGVIVISLTSDVASATDGLQVDFSSDGTVGGIISSDNFTISAGAQKTFSFQAAAKYYRVVYTNGGGAQSSFNMQTVLKPYYVKPSSHRIADPIVGEDDAELTKAVLTALSDTGAFINITATKSNNLRVTDAESTFAIAQGLVTGYSIVHKFGKNEDVGATFEPLSIGAIYQTVQPVNATTLRIKAGGNALDTVTGTGARKVMLQGLDETGAEVTEELELAGVLASAVTTITFIRLYRAYISESGTYAGAGADSQAADIVIEKGAGAADWATIEKPDVGRSQTQIGQYTVPLGKTAYVDRYLLTTDSNKAVDFLFFKRGSILDAAAPYEARRTVIEEIGVQGHLDGTFAGGQAFGELTDIGWMCKAAAAAQVTVDFEIKLVTN